MNIFDKVRERLAKGWIKGKRHDEGSCCLLGAFENTGVSGWNHEQSAEHMFPKELEALRQCVVEHPVFLGRLYTRDVYNSGVPGDNIGKEVVVIAGFNNHEDTTLEDVLAMVDCAEDKSAIATWVKTMG